MYKITSYVSNILEKMGINSSNLTVIINDDNIIQQLNNYQCNKIVLAQDISAGTTYNWKICYSRDDDHYEFMFNEHTYVLNATTVACYITTIQNTIVYSYTLLEHTNFQLKRIFDEISKVPLFYNFIQHLEINGWTHPAVTYWLRKQEFVQLEDLVLK